MRYVAIPAMNMKIYTMGGTIKILPSKTAQEANLKTELVAVLDNGAKGVSFNLIGGSV
jgi:hypothetical protein